MPDAGLRPRYSFGGRARKRGVTMSVRDSAGDRTRAIPDPSISAIPFREISNGALVPLLGERERSLLASIASSARFGRRNTIYREGDPADCVYNIVEGVAKTFRTLPDGTRHIAGFHFADDLIGLGEEGIYVNQAEAVTPVAAYRLPLAALENLVRSDPSLDFDLLLKLSHEIREAQRHALILVRRDAVGKIAMFIEMVRRLEVARGSAANEISLPIYPVGHRGLCRDFARRGQPFVSPADDQ
jgi:CRP-like cAMP-binding protein